MPTAGLDKLVRHLRTLSAVGHFREHSDAQLLESFDSHGDQLAFEILVRRHARLVFGVCRRVLGQGPDVEDAFQATLLVLARKRGSFRRQASIASWLYGVAYRVARKQQSRRARQQRREQTGVSLEAIAENKPMANDPAQQAGWRELGIVLDEEVQRLPKKNREALVLCLVEGLSAVDAAKRLDCPLPTLKSRLAKARELLRQRLTRRGVSLSAAGVAVLLAEHTAGAAVPPKVLHAAVQAAIAFAVRPVASALVSAKAAALAQGMLKTVALAKLSLALILVLSTVAVGFATTMVLEESSSAVAPSEIARDTRAPGQQPEGVKGRTDSLGDPLPPCAVARLGTLRFMHNLPVGLDDEEFQRALEAGATSLVVRAVYSPNGKTIASLGNVGTIRLWDAKTGKRLLGPPDTNDFSKRYSAIAFSPDGSRLASGISDARGAVKSSVLLWDVAAGKELSVFAIESVPHPLSLGFTEDSKCLVVAGARDVLWLNAATGKVQQSLQPLGSAAPKLLAPAYTNGVSPGGNFLVAQIRQLPTKESTGEINRQSDVVGIDLVTGKERWRVNSELESLPPQAYAFSADGSQVVAKVGHARLEVFDNLSGKRREIAPIPGYIRTTSRGIGAVAISPDGRTVAFTVQDRMVMLSDPTDSTSWREFTTRITHTDIFMPATCLAFSPDGKTLLVGTGGDLQLYDVATLKEIVSWEGHRSSVEEVAFSADGQRILTGSAHAELFPQELARWKVGTWKQLEFSTTSSPLWPKVGRASFDHTVYVGKEGKDRFNLYNMTNGKLLGHCQLPGDQDRDVFGFFSPKSKFYIVFDGTGADVDLKSLKTYVFAVPSCKLLCQFPSLLAASWVGWRVPRLAFSADESLVAMLGWQDGLIHIIETNTGKEVQRLGQLRTDIRRGGQVIVDLGTLALSPDGKLVATWSQDWPFVRIFDVATGKERLRLTKKDEQHSYLTLAWSPDNRTLAIGDKTIQLIEVSTGKLRREFTGHEGQIRSLAFSPDGRYLASGSTDTTVLIWDAWGK